MVSSSYTSNLHSFGFVGSFFLKSGDDGVSMAQGNVCMSLHEHTPFNRDNKTMLCTLQVYSRFNCLFKRIPAFRLLIFHCCCCCCFVSSFSREAVGFLGYPFVKFVIVYSLSSASLSWSLWWPCVVFCPSVFAFNYPSLLLQIIIIKTYSNCFRREAKAGAFYLRIAFYYTFHTVYVVVFRLQCNFKFFFH